MKYILFLLMISTVVFAEPNNVDMGFLQVAAMGIGADGKPLQPDSNSIAIPNRISTVPKNCNTCYDYQRLDLKLSEPMFDANDLQVLIQFYNNSGKNYREIIIKNWLLCNPAVGITEKRGKITFYTVSRQYICIEVGDLNFDGITNYKDLARLVSIEKKIRESNR